MRRLIVLSASLLLAACATTPKPSEPAPVEPSAHTRGEIIGLTAEELVSRFGTPALQIREGNILKLQFRRGQCVLDAYLYPSGGNAPHRVTYVDSRTPSLADLDQARCIDFLEAP